MKPTDRTRVNRLKERGRYEAEVIERILDEGLVCHVGFVDGGQPFVIPMAYARLDRELILHGSPKSRMLQVLGGGADVCVTVTHLDGLVLARSAFHSSMNYRAVVILGRPRRITDPQEKRRALDTLTGHLIPGRVAEARPMTDKEVAATEVVALRLDEASAKVRTGPPHDPDSDLGHRVWAGVLPLRLTPGVPEPAPDLGQGIAAPEYVRAYRRPVRPE